MHGLLKSMIHDAPASAADVLALEQAARLQGTGLAKADLPGFWQLHQTWSRRGSRPRSEHSVAAGPAGLPDSGEPER